MDVSFSLFMFSLKLLPFETKRKDAYDPGAVLEKGNVFGSEPAAQILTSEVSGYLRPSKCPSGTQSCKLNRLKTNKHQKE